MGSVLLRCTLTWVPFRIVLMFVVVVYRHTEVLNFSDDMPAAPEDG
jgi:hypothetical protein